MLGTIDSYSRYITKVVKAHDRELYARRSHLGHVSVYRNTRKAELVSHDNDGFKLYNIVNRPQHIFALTDNWTANGKPVEWGGEVVLQRLQKYDCWNRDAVGEIVDKLEKAEEIKKKDFRNNTEAFFSDKRHVFKDAFKDIRTANMDKSEKRRRNREKKLNL